ncbi:uncharacterized protein F5891DRAFT_984542 [Suillus fuscotomentosus]|uniref:Uncharacterized protein n=1 Tax=Suillus fuscotomentosus TaxID=1912939 RepID=A0AAD4HFZ1_9AGAM|nr:uncharacterized protein F5891DRAFT_984542 [Suillus fuscotomentosus]KAG1895092.1 hypothetical protein F5891DRAFT_984542 [Suillus fuscotomentosus]
MSDQHSASDSESNKQPPANEEEVTVLQSYLEQWLSANPLERKNILRAATMEARTKAPVMSIVLSKARKATYDTWFCNNAKAKKPGKPPIKMGQKWTERSVIDTLRKKELLKKIEDETGAKPGTKEMMNHYTVHLNQLMASLSPEDLEEAQETANDWNTRGVPDDVKDGESKVQVAGFVFRPLGSTTSHPADRHDYNQEFGGAASFMKSYNWKVIEPEWDAYAASVFEGDVDENPVARKKGRQDNTYTLDVGDDGYPVVPAYGSMDLDTKKAVVRAFLTWHYRKCCGDPKVSVLWKYVIHRYNKIIPGQYLPEGHNLAEPSKLRQIHATELLQFWHDRQEEGEQHVFEFVGWWDNDSQDIVLAADQDERVTSRAQPTLWTKKTSGSKSNKSGHPRQPTVKKSSSGNKVKDGEPAAAACSGVKTIKSASASTLRKQGGGLKNKPMSSNEDSHYTGKPSDESSDEPSDDSEDDTPPPRKGRLSEIRNKCTGSHTHRSRASLKSQDDSNCEVELDIACKAVVPSDKHARKDMGAHIRARAADISLTDRRVQRDKGDVKQTAKVTARERSKSSMAQTITHPIRMVGPASWAGGSAPGNQARGDCEDSVSTGTGMLSIPIARHLAHDGHTRKEGRKRAAEETLEGPPAKRSRSRAIIKTAIENVNKPADKKLKKRVTDECMDGSPSKRTQSKTSNLIPAKHSRKPNSQYAADYVKS